MSVILVIIIDVTVVIFVFRFLGGGGGGGGGMARFIIASSIFAISASFFLRNVPLPSQN